jgi:hypothetical protein
MRTSTLVASLAILTQAILLWRTTATLAKFEAKMLVTTPVHTFGAINETKLFLLPDEQFAMRYSTIIQCLEGCSLDNGALRELRHLGIDPGRAKENENTWMKVRKYRQECLRRYGRML